MKKSLDHLPLRKQAELRQVVETVRAAFEEAISTRRAARLKDGRILKVILYGSYVTYFPLLLGGKFSAGPATIGLIMASMSVTTALLLGFRPADRRRS